MFWHQGRPYGISHILEALHALGVRQGDTLFVHADLKSFGRPDRAISRDAFIEGFLDALKEAVGARGNIIMPTFSYSFCKQENFDPKTTPSTVGILSEYFRKMSGVKRSADPIFSVAADGADAAYFTEVGTNCFGENSIFEKLYKRKATLVFLGETFDITYMHFVEQTLNVPYRFIKKFTGNIKVGKEMKKFTFDYNVRPLDKDIDYDLEKIAKYFEHCGILRVVPLAHGKLRSVTAIDAFRAIAEGIKNDPYFLLKHKPVGL